jgi:hypothetical protein
VLKGKAKDAGLASIDLKNGSEGKTYATHMQARILMRAGRRGQCSQHSKHTEKSLVGEERLVLVDGLSVFFNLVKANLALQLLPR